MWPCGLETRLRDYLNRSVEVVNCDVPDYSISQGYRDYRLRASQHGAQAVTIIFAQASCDVVMVTRSHEVDRRILAKVIGENVAYLGMVGSKTKVP